MPIHDWTRVDAGIFHDFHTSWIIEIKRLLNNGLLPPDHYALAEQVAGGIGPDVLALQLSAAEVPPSTTNGPTQSGAPSMGAVLTAAPRARLSGCIEEKPHSRPRRHPRSVVIRHVSNHRIIALVEIVSPGNKSSRDALRAFLRKATSALRAGIHLLIVDLFPPGRRDPQGIHAALLGEYVEKVDVTLPADKTLTLAAYTAGAEKRYYVNFAALGDELPEMPLFLDPEHHILVPLEAAYRSAWETLPQFWRDTLERRP